LRRRGLIPLGSLTLQLGRQRPQLPGALLATAERQPERPGRGLALNVAFIAGGAATFLAAWVLRRSVAKAVAGPLLLGFFGCTSVVSGLVDARRFGKDPAWRDFARPTLLWAIAAAVTFICIPLAPASLFGVAQCVFVATGLSWMIVTMIRARSLAAPPAPAGPEPGHLALGHEATLNTIGDA